MNTLNSSHIRHFINPLIRSSNQSAKQCHRHQTNMRRLASTTAAESGKEPNKGDPSTIGKVQDKPIISRELAKTLRENVSWFNGQYERIFGIDEIRQMQDNVLEAESQFVKITQLRKSCQDKIENYKESIKNIRDKLDITPRQSDNYLKLITQEHSLLREQLSHDAQLSQLKDKEQWSLDNLSKLLRHSHELERLRQERAKYWQIISLGLSVVGGVVALFAQKVRNQRTTLKELSLMNERILSMKEHQEVQSNELMAQLSRLRSVTKDIADKLHEEHHRQSRPTDLLDHKQSKASGENLSGSSWTSWFAAITGYSYIKSKLYA